MRQNKYVIYFYDWNNNPEGGSIQVYADNIGEAIILAQAERINNGLQWKNIYAKQQYNYEDKNWEYID